MLNRMLVPAVILLLGSFMTGQPATMQMAVVKSNQNMMTVESATPVFQPAETVAHVGIGTSLGSPA